MSEMSPAAASLDPSTPPETLAQLAMEHPALRPLIASNPTAYPGLLEWLAAIGDPEIDAALAARSGGGYPVASETPAETHGDAEDQQEDSVTAEDRHEDSVVAEDPHEGPVVAEDPVEPEQSGEMHRRDRRRTMRIVGWVSLVTLVLSSLGGAVVLGWWWASSVAADNAVAPSTTLVRVAMPGYEPGDVALMPDVRGLDEQEATQALVDAGVPVSVITVTTRSTAGAPGRVIEQSPVFGAENPAIVTLVISTPATVPAVAGRPAIDVIDELNALGAKVVQVKKFVPGIAAGEALGITPAPGGTIPDSVTLQIADSAASLALAELDRSSGNCTTRSTGIVAGVDRTQLVTCGSSTSGTTTTWNLASRGDVFEGSLGIYGTDVTAEQVRATIAIDGVVVVDRVISGHEVVPFSVVTTGSTTIAVTATSVTDWSTLALVDAAVLGGVDAIAALRAS